MYASSTHWWNQSMSIFLPGASLTLGWPIRDNALQKKAFVPYLMYTLVINSGRILQKHKVWPTAKIDNGHPLGSVMGEEVEEGHFQ